MQNQVILILFGLLTGFSSFAQNNNEASFKVQVAYDSIGLEEQFEVKYTLKNTKAVAQFQMPAFDEFKLLAGPMISSSMSIINGNMTQSVSYTYILQPTQIGIFNLPATSIETEEGVLVTDDAALVIVEKMERIHHNNSAFQDPFQNDPFFNQGFSPRQHMDDMMKDFDKMFKFDAPNDLYKNNPIGPNPSPKKEKPKKKEKTYKI